MLYIFSYFYVTSIFLKVLPHPVRSQASLWYIFPPKSFPMLFIHFCFGLPPPPHLPPHSSIYISLFLHIARRFGSHGDTNTATDYIVFFPSFVRYFHFFTWSTYLLIPDMIHSRCSTFSSIHAIYIPIHIHHPYILHLRFSSLYAQHLFLLPSLTLLRSHIWFLAIVLVLLVSSQWDIDIFFYLVIP